MRRGFTLLEVMVSLAILAISLVAITGICAGNYVASEYARGMTTATLLARSKMIDIEEEMWEDGSFPDDDKELDGDFSDDGQPEFRWRANVRKHARMYSCTHACMNPHTHTLTPQHT